MVQVCIKKQYILCGLAGVGGGGVGVGRKLIKMQMCTPALPATWYNIPHVYCIYLVNHSKKSFEDFVL
jgi:hypothetical protein